MAMNPNFMISSNFASAIKSLIVKWFKSQPQSEGEENGIANKNK
jgi:hypothetical protein